MGPEFKVDPRVQGSRYELLVYFDLVQICFLVLFIKTKSFLWAIVRFSQRMCSKLCFTTTILFHLVSFTLTLGSYSWEECVILIFLFVCFIQICTSQMLGYCVLGGSLVCMRSKTPQDWLFSLNDQEGLSSIASQYFLNACTEMHCKWKLPLPPSGIYVHFPNQKVSPAR